MKSTVQGFPRIGSKRELKFATEKFWAGNLTIEELENVGADIRLQNLNLMRQKGIDVIPCGDFSFYDRMLDTAFMLGVIPERFQCLKETFSELELYFAMARGCEWNGQSIEAMDMTKWFNTNYHYITPEIACQQNFKPDFSWLYNDLSQARTNGFNVEPYVIGPLTFLALSQKAENLDVSHCLKRLQIAYGQLLAKLEALNVSVVHLEEPILATDMSGDIQQALESVYSYLAGSANVGIVVQTYFNHVGDKYERLTQLPIRGIGLDFVHGKKNLDDIAKLGFPQDKLLYAGVVDGRNIWRADYGRINDAMTLLLDHVEPDRLVLSSSCSLLHCPVSLEHETRLADSVKSNMAFATEKLDELNHLKQVYSDADQCAIQVAIERRREFENDCTRRNADVRTQLEHYEELAVPRSIEFKQRQKEQQYLNLPPLATTTIGSFPQSREVRALRFKWRKGEITETEYQDEIKSRIRDVIELQENIGLDVFVHGEFERNDMVEFFGEQLDGFLFTENGWVQSYGTRCVKPPLIYGDVHRPADMTVDHIKYAQSLTDKPVKGMLTGPVTILNWSFVRDDIPRATVCAQIAFAVREEVQALEKNNINIIQVDEAALREGVPLRDEQKKEYLKWAVDCFLLATGVVDAKTQIHTHMCYSNFNDIIDDIIRMDADVITIENTRSGNALLSVFKDKQYPNQIGPGVYDIHSPVIPTTSAIEKNIRNIFEVLDYAQIWVNPDCGLKTRQDCEIVPALKNMVEAATLLRR